MITNFTLTQFVNLLPTGLYTRYEFDADLQRFKPRQNKPRDLEVMVMSYFRRKRPDCSVESIHTTGTQKKVRCFNVDGFCGNCNTVFETMSCFYHCCPCQRARPVVTKEDFRRGTEEREIVEVR